MNLFDNKDKRLPYLVNYLKDYNLKLGTDVDSDVLILPITGVDDLGYIKRTNVNVFDLYDIYPFKDLVLPNASPKFMNLVHDRFKLHFYYDDNLKKENAYYTAEGLLSLIISKTDFSLKDKKILIIGYGACGKEIASLLSVFTQNIDIFNRTFYPEISSKYCYVRDLTSLDYDLIINTVPVKLINKNDLKDGVIFDIASKRGFDEDVFIHHELGIPNMMPKDGALSMAKRIKEILDEITNNSKNK